MSREVKRGIIVNLAITVLLCWFRLVGLVEAPWWVLTIFTWAPLAVFIVVFLVVASSVFIANVFHEVAKRRLRGHEKDNPDVVSGGSAAEGS